MSVQMSKQTRLRYVETADGRNARIDVRRTKSTNNNKPSTAHDEFKLL